MINENKIKIENLTTLIVNHNLCAGLHETRLCYEAELYEFVYINDIHIDNITIYKRDNKAVALQRILDKLNQLEKETSLFIEG